VREGEGLCRPSCFNQEREDVLQEERSLPCNAMEKDFLLVLRTALACIFCPFPLATLADLPSLSRFPFQRQLRDLTSLYHDAQNHINYDNLDSIIDAEFAPPTPRTRPPMASLQDLHIEMTAPNSLSHRQALTTPAISERRSFVSNQEDPYKFNVFHPLAESGSEARNKVVRDQETARRIAAWTRLTDPRVAGAIGGAASIKLRKELEAEEEKEDLFGEGAASSLTDQSSQDSSAFALAGRKNDWAASTEYDLTERQRRLVETLLGLEANGTRPNMEEVLREQPRIAAEEEKVRIYWEAGLDEEFGELSAEQEERVREVAERVEEKMGEEMRKSLGMREREEAGLMMDGEEEALGEERV
jgi:hypothetical protein